MSTDLVANTINPFFPLLKIVRETEALTIVITQKHLNQKYYNKAIACYSLLP